MPQPQEPLAIVGMGCRFPGGANTPAALWELLRDGVDAITEVPDDRWNAARFFHPNAAAPGRMVSRWGGFVSNLDTFDAGFFSIAPREAAHMDPQHRWLAEVAWEAIEDAGLPPAQLAGTRTGVFLGISSSDYPMLHRHDFLAIDGYVNIGSALSIAANRLSYLFDLRGPSIAVDTACSSSLVALHLAARSLWSGECDHALVGGANALIVPDSSIGFSQARMLSPRGRCRAFDAAADGYVRAEGAGAILLIPQAMAAKLDLHPRALLVATASNQDGHSSSLAVPRQGAQEELIREALRGANAQPRDVVYVETHGTGTPVGDPIEARALGAVLGEGRKPAERLLIGSVKTNIGHLESASGIAGLMKAVLVLEQRSVPPNLHFTTPNPLLPLERVCVPTALTPLPGNPGRVPLVGVNSFGFGGTNAHALLTAAPEPAARASAAEGPCLFPLSARSPGAFAAYAQVFADFVGESSAPSLREVCAAAALKKSHHPLRHALVADSLAGLQTQLRALTESSAQESAARPKIAFVFSGQGPQWWAMGRQLYREEKIVREVWESCDALSQKLGGPKLLDALLAAESESLLDHTDIAQPALFALQAGLVELWRTWGIEPEIVIGHSVGEAAAAWAAGGYDFKGILRVIISRSRWQEKTRGRGRMLVAAIREDEAREWETKFSGSVTIAALNSPQQVTLSGEPSALAEIAAALDGAGVFCRFLRTDYAFHSTQMDALENGLRRELAGIAGGPSKVAMISTVTGEPVNGADLDADYWWRNVRQPVRFAAGIERALRDGANAFVEIGPHPVMASAIAEIALAQKTRVSLVASLRRDEDERITMLRGLAGLYRSGAKVRWKALYSRPARAVRLPPYPWQRQRLWHEAPGTKRDIRSAPAHPLLGDRQPLPQPTWLNHLDARLIPWLADHRLAGSAVLPAAAYVEMAAAAVREVLGESTIFLEEIRFHRMLFLPSEQPVPTCVRLDPAAGTFQILAAPPEAPDVWEVHAEGAYRPGRLHPPAPCDLAALGARLGEERDIRELYRELSGIGQVFGPAFQGLTSLRVEGNEALGGVADQGERDAPDYLLFPPLLDGCFHPSAPLARQLNHTSRAVVASIRQVHIFHPLPEKVWSHLQLSTQGERSFFADVAIHDADGGLLARVDAMAVRAIDSAAVRRERKLYQLAWEPAPISLEGADFHARDAVMIFGEALSTVSQLADALRERKIPVAPVLCVTADEESRLPGAIYVDRAREDWAVQLWDELIARGPLPTRMIYLAQGNGASSGDAANAARECSQFLALVQARLAIDGSERPARWLVLTDRAQPVLDGEVVPPDGATLWGFARTVRTELPQWRVSLLDHADAVPAETLLRELFVADIEPEVALRGDGRWVRRLREIEIEPAPMANPPSAFELETARPGRTDSLQFRGRARRAPGPGEVEIEIAAAGLNFRDLMKVLGIYPLKEGEPASLGDEFSGSIVRVGRGVEEFVVGDRVMGFAPAGGAFSSSLTVPAEAVWKVPENLSFVEAASIPVVFGTAYYALHSLARLRGGETILIHAAAGGVGLAAVQLAQHAGAIVLATAGSEEKRAYLRSLGVAHVMDSRTLDFADGTLSHTGGRGVDVVLNSLAGAFQQKSLAVCAPHGRFVEIGKRDLFENHSLPLAAFQRSLTFSAFDLAAVMASPNSAWPDVRRALAEGFTDERLKPIPTTTFAAGDAVSAFRLMQGAQHIGKIMIEFKGQRAPELPPEFWPRADGTYLVTGGLSGLGLATARWLAERGAMHLALVNTSGEPSAADAPSLDELRAHGVAVITLAADVSDPVALARALQILRETAPPLRGIFHSAMVTRDRTLATMNRADLEAVFAPKVAGAWNLHEQTLGMELDCFVMYSSIASLIGAMGQANYAGANAFLDALAHFRRSQGMPALTVNWGQIADVGIVSQRPEIARYLESVGIAGLSSKDALATLARLLGSREAQVGVMDVDWDKLSRASENFRSSPIIRGLIRRDASATQAGAEWRAAILALPADAQLAAVSELISAQLAATLGMAPGSIEATRPLAQLGMDSLMAVELKSRIETAAGVELPLSVFSADLTTAVLAERFWKILGKGASSTEVPSPVSPAESVVPPPPNPEGVGLVDATEAPGAEPEGAEPADPATHWTTAPQLSRRAIPHPLIAGRPRDVFRSFREYGWPGAQPRYWLRALTVLGVGAARTPIRAIESWRVRRRVIPRTLTLPPVFIIGHWRSGTTHLHQLLSQDPQFGVVTTLQATSPLDVLTPVSRLLVRTILPLRRPMDAVPVSIDAPMEEELAMASFGPLSFFHAFFFPREGRRIYREAVHFDGVAKEWIEEWWRAYGLFLKKVYCQQSGRQLLLKNPANTARIAALRQRFPGAKFIHLHRHPEKVYASTLFLHRRLQAAWSLQEADVGQLRETVLANYADLMSAYFEQSRGMSDRELIEVRMTDLETNPMATLEAIYRQLGLPDFESASPGFSSYLERQGVFSKNRLSLNDEERDAVRAALAPVYERWNYR